MCAESRYHLHGEMLALEAQGKPAFLRDMHGDVVILCNDGNFYCNITTFDHSKDYVRRPWLGCSWRVHVRVRSELMRKPGFEETPIQPANNRMVM